MIPNSEIILEAKQVGFQDRLGLTDILKEISFQMKNGDRAVILGRSGSGKTSLLRLLNRLSEPTTGILFFEGTSYGKIPVISLRQQIVLVPQEPKLLGMTVQETLAYPLTLKQIPRQEISDRIMSYCEQLHIPESWYDKNELELSLGQRQLVTIARGLIMQPKVLLLDEPTSALDINTSSHLIQCLKAQMMTILMVNHQLDIAEIFSDRVLYLQEGKLVKDIDNYNLNWYKLKQEMMETEQEWS